MQLTQTEIEDALLSLIDRSVLADAVSGVVCLEGQRPKDSRAEDIVVIFTDSLPGQTQTGTVTLNVYVPDIDPWQDGTWIKDRRRTGQIEALARNWLATLNDPSHGHCYRYYPKQSVATMGEPEINQHFVVVKIGYEYYDGE